MTMTTANKLAVVILAMVVVAAVAVGSCEYRFEVHTGRRLMAGTNAYIHFGLFGEGGHGWWQTDDGQGAKYERGKRDVFAVNSTEPCINPCNLALRLTADGSGYDIDPSWYCDSVTVTVSGDIYSKKVFPVGRWIKDSDGTVNTFICS